MSFEEHPDPRVMEAIIILCDVLCQRERNTGEKSVFILRENDFSLRAVDGKPGIPDNITDAELIEINL